MTPCGGGHNKAVFGFSNGMLGIFCLETEELISTIGVHTKEITALDIIGNQDSLMIATGSEDGISKTNIVLSLSHCA